MRPDIPWNVAGIPPEAREAARAAARREGLSVGEWMTRRILQSFTGSDDAGTRESWTGTGAGYAPLPEAQPTRRDTEDMLAHVARSETESGEVFRRIEEQLRGVARRLEAAERSQSENNRAMSKAANEINIAAREQAQAFDQLGNSVIGLADRIERVERTSGHDGLRDAVKGLHQGLSRLADQISATANQSATQISALANNLESVAGRAGQARSESEAATRAFEQRISQIDERVRGVERLMQASQETIQHALTGLDARRDEDAAAARRASETAIAITRLEDKLARLEARGADPALDRRLSGIERSLSEIAARFDRPSDVTSGVADDLRRLAQRVAATEASQRDGGAVPTGGAGRIAHADLQSSQTVPPATDSDTAPFSNAALPDNAPPFQASDERFPPFVAAEPDEFQTALAAAPTFDNAGIADEPMNPPAAEADDSFLLAARRSARSASAQAEVERGARAGGFAWGTHPASFAAESKSDSRRTYLWVAIIALLAIAAVGAGAILSQRLGSPSAHPGSALFGRETARATASARPVARPPARKAAAAGPELKTFVVPVGPDGTAPGIIESDNARISPVEAPRAATPAPGSPVLHGAPTAPAHAPATLSPLDKLTALANAGNAKAELVVGLKYLDGDGVAVNEVDAAKWLTRAANQNQPVAQYRLGTMFERGRGVALDATKAVHWYTLAAQAGNRKAMHNLAVAFASGAGTAKNLAEAARWFSKAAALGLSDSQFNLAVLYERGLGVPQSLLDAYKWYAIAAGTGDAESKARIEALATQLSTDDRAAAQRSAHAFHPQPLDVKANVAPLMSDVTG